MKKIRVRFERDDQTELIDVIVRASERDSEVDSLMKKISGSASDTLTVSAANDTICRIDTRDIISVSVMGKHVQIVTESGSYSSRQSLAAIEAELYEWDFVRISRYEIVNLNKVLKYDFTLSGTLRLELAGGIETWASRRCIPEIRKRLKGKR